MISSGKSTATVKFRALEHQVNQALLSAPQPGPAVFIVRCLYAMPLFELDACGLSQLILSAVGEFLKGYTNNDDLVEAEDLAAQLFVDVDQGFVVCKEDIILKMIEVFDLKLVNLARVKNLSSNKTEAFIEKYISQKVESKSYRAAVSLLEQFNIRCFGESFFSKMIVDNAFGAAEKLASYMGKSMLCALVEEYVKRNMLNDACEIFKRNNLQKEFPDVYRKCKQSALKTLAEKGCWDVAEEKSRKDRQLLEFLVYLAMEAGYREKANELCDRYSLEGFVKEKEPEALLENRYLRLHELLINKPIWVDRADILQTATSRIEGCKVVGLDCEWNPDCIKGSKRSKVSDNSVSIMQIASEKFTFIFDMIKLYADVPEVLNNCLIRIFQSPRILKLGYNIQCDMYQLSRSYQKLDCFMKYEMLLDIEKVFKEPCGGLSGLVKKILGGAVLNKATRDSDWEQRPLTRQQLEYAALDAVVLIHLFHNIHNHPNCDGARHSNVKMEWKSHITSKIGDTKKSRKKGRRSEKKD